MELLYLMGVAGALGVVHVFYRKLTRTPASDRDLRKEHAVRLFRCVFVVTGVSMAGLSVLTLTPEAYSSQEASGVAMAQRHFFATANAFHATAFLALTQLAATLLVAAAAEDRVQVKSGGGGGDELGVNDGHGHASAGTQYIAGSQKQSLLTLPMYCWLTLLYCNGVKWVGLTGAVVAGACSTPATLSARSLGAFRSALYVTSGQLLLLHVGIQTLRWYRGFLRLRWPSMRGGSSDRMPGETARAYQWRRLLWQLLWLQFWRAVLAEVFDAVLLVRTGCPAAHVSSVLEETGVFVTTRANVTTTELIDSYVLGVNNAFHRSNLVAIGLGATLEGWRYGIYFTILSSGCFALLGAAHVALELRRAGAGEGEGEGEGQGASLAFLGSSAALDTAVCAAAVVFTISMKWGQRHLTDLTGDGEAQEGGDSRERLTASAPSSSPRGRGVASRRRVPYSIWEMHQVYARHGGKRKERRAVVWLLVAINGYFGVWLVEAVACAAIGAGSPSSVAIGVSTVLHAAILFICSRSGPFMPGYSFVTGRPHPLSESNTEQMDISATIRKRRNVFPFLYFLLTAGACTELVAAGRARRYPTAYLALLKSLFAIGASGLYVVMTRAAMLHLSVDDVNCFDDDEPVGGGGTGEGSRSVELGDLGGVGDGGRDGESGDARAGPEGTSRMGVSEDRVTALRTVGVCCIVGVLFGMVVYMDLDPDLDLGPTGGQPGGATSEHWPGIVSDWSMGATSPGRRWTRRPYSIAYELVYHLSVVLGYGTAGCILDLAGPGSVLRLHIQRLTLVVLAFGASGATALVGAVAAAARGGAPVAAANGAFAVACLASAWMMGRIRRGVAWEVRREAAR